MFSSPGPPVGNWIAVALQPTPLASLRSFKAVGTSKENRSSSGFHQLSGPRRPTRWFADWIQPFAALRRLIGVHDWQRDQAARQKLNYYLGEGDFIAHYDTSGGVHMPLARIERGNAPFLHEATHVLLTLRGAFFALEFPSDAAWLDSVNSRPSWLEEGVATNSDLVAKT